VSLVTFRPFVGVVVSKDDVATDFPEVETVTPPARVLVIRRLPDCTATMWPSLTSRQSAMVVYDAIRHAYVVGSIGISLWSIFVGREGPIPRLAIQGIYSQEQGRFLSIS